MTKDLIRYDLLVQEALKGVVRKVLSEAAKDGLPGDHHFYVSFRTDFPGAKVSARLREKYPQEMTIVLQHQFWDLIISEQQFEVGLSFSGVPEKLVVPFDAVTGFFDPSVQFGLKFEAQDEAANTDAAAAEPAVLPVKGAEPLELAPKRPTLPVAAKPGAAKAPSRQGKSAGDGEKPAKKDKAAKAAKPEAAKDKSGDDQAGAEVVSLDAFRKKS
ncbi:MAG TPA: ClpXP protease specificity-enhancing factor SspB [Beijerinckiaceae bacterium]|nr:ClpXP protease specificity-enhancing factor SspB [Beijerinckiaceae bacterium]